MSDSNVGGRKDVTIRNHIFMIKCIINDVLKTGKCLDLQIYNYKQCFDVMWFEETLNDIYEANIKDDRLAIIHEANRKNKMAVKTPLGMTDRVDVNNIVLQGDKLSPLECSVQVDSIAKECVVRDRNMFTYKGDVKVPPLTMVDDLLAVAQCGVKSVKLNSFLNAKTNMKKIQYGEEKFSRYMLEKIKYIVLISQWINGP